MKIFNLCYYLVMEIVRYNHLNSYLKNVFGERVLKICVDGNFTCPNRDGTCSFGGCIFCGEKGSGDNLFAINKIGKNDKTIKSIENQVKYFLNSYKGERANKFIVYFQNFTNTYDTVENLKIRYDAALNCSDKIVGLSIATRPDCIDPNIVNLLKSYTDKYYVMVELGLQTANDEIGKIINRGFDTARYIEVAKLLKENGIPFVSHVMIGLPNESEKDIETTIAVINNSNSDGIKIHSTFILNNTVLHDMYLNGEYTPISLEHYALMVAKIISNLNKDIIIHRITGDPPKDKLVEPEWTARKKIVINEINRKLSALNIVQGDKKLKFN